MQAALRFLYPPQCIACGEQVQDTHGLCGPCWRDAPFITGLVCDQCGLPLLGDAGEGHSFPRTIPLRSDPHAIPDLVVRTPKVSCDDCLAIARPWARGRAALLYDGTGRRIVLGLKHGDRLELARPAGRWLARAVAPLLHSDMLLVPVPLHWTRLVMRRFNQAAELALALARETGLECCPDLLIRRRRTPSQDGRSRTARFANLDAAIATHPRRAALTRGRDILLVDDVMTAGATFAACADACLAAGARQVDIAALARVAKPA